MPYSLKQLLSNLEKARETRNPHTMQGVLEDTSNHSLDRMVVRFDVERDAFHAVEVARQMAAIKIPSTFYFHTRTNSYDRHSFDLIRELGHEIGFHHECLDRCHGDFDQAKLLFVKEVEQFRKDGVPLVTVCSHGESGLRRKGYRHNWELFKKFPSLLGEVGILGEVQIILKEVAWEYNYISDVFTRYKDFWTGLDAAKTDERVMLVLVHPHRWRGSFLPTFWEIGKDLKQRYQNKLLGGRSYRTVLKEE